MIIKPRAVCYEHAQHERVAWLHKKATYDRHPQWLNALTL
jgi:hypothetical protein